MQFSIQFLAAFAAAFAPIQALPAPGTTANPAANILARQSKDCSSDKITCNDEDSYWAPLTPKAVCRRVIDSLRENEIRTQPRDHCITEKEGEGHNAGSRCCISWSHEVPRGVPYTEFKKVAETLLDTCLSRDGSDGEHVYGEMHEVKIGGECMKVCLGADPKGCNYFWDYQAPQPFE